MKWFNKPKPADIPRAPPILEDAGQRFRLMRIAITSEFTKEGQLRIQVAPDDTWQLQTYEEQRWQESEYSPPGRWVGNRWNKVVDITGMDAAITALRIMKNKEQVFYLPE